MIETMSFYSYLEVSKENIFQPKSMKQIIHNKIPSPIILFGQALLVDQKVKKSDH